MSILKWLALFFVCAFVALADTPKTVILTIPADLIDRARIKSQLIEELRASIYDDHKGILNLQREKHIQELARKLR